MLQQSRGIVLHTLRYGDEALIVHILTEASGCQSFMVRMSHSRRKPSPHVLMQPLALLDLSWEEKARSSIHRPKSVAVGTPLVSIPFDPHKTSIALFLSEFLHHALRAEPSSPGLFDYLYHSVLWLDAARSDFANFHLVFLLRLTRFLGLFPEVDAATVGGYFDLEACTFTARPPLHGHFLEPQDTARLPLLLRMRYETMHLFRLSGRERNRFLQLLNDYYRLHCPGFPELKSLSVLREVFA